MTHRAPPTCRTRFAEPRLRFGARLPMLLLATALLATVSATAADPATPRRPRPPAGHPAVRAQAAAQPRTAAPPTAAIQTQPAPRPTAAVAQRAASPAPRARTKVVDPAVTPAGGACGQCAPGGCRHKPGLHGHHRDCRDGACVPYCPVRPATFGFYGTQWRRWPGQGVVPVSGEAAATPVKPPRSAVPGADEESRGPAASELPEPEDAAPSDGGDTSNGDEPARDTPAAPEPDAPAPEPAEPAMEKEPTPRVEKSEPAPPEPRPVPRGEEKPAATPATREEKPEATPAKPKPRPEDEDLFDESAAARNVRRRISIAVAPEPPDPSTLDAVQPVAHSGVGTGGGTAMRRSATRGPAVPRVPFDPQAEAARMNARK